MTKTSLDISIISIFINNIKKIDLKNNKMIKKLKIKLIFAFFIINIGLIRFYLSLKI